MGAHAHAQTEQEKLREYFMVFGGLFVITILEVGATFLPGSKLFRDIVIVTLACLKATAVGYYYMHLKHETKWLRIVAICPLIMAFYAAVLIPDTYKERPISPYLPPLERVFPQAQHEAEKKKDEEALGDDTVPAPETATHPEAAAVEVNAAAPGSGHEAPPASAPQAAPANPAPEAAAPAAAGAGSDNVNDRR